MLAEEHVRQVAKERGWTYQTAFDSRKESYDKASYSYRLDRQQEQAYQAFIRGISKEELDAWDKSSCLLWEDFQAERTQAAKAKQVSAMRSQVCALGNRFAKTMSRKEAFRRAWDLAKLESGPIVYDREQRKRLAAVQQWTDVQSANQHAI